MFRFVYIKVSSKGIHSFYSPELVNWSPELGQEASEVLPNRTALYKPQVTPSNILWRSRGTLGHMDSISPLSYIYEAGECFKPDLQLSQIKQTAWVFCTAYVISMDFLKPHGFDMYFIFCVVLPLSIMHSAWDVTPLAQYVISRCLMPHEQLAGHRIGNPCCCSRICDLFITVSHF